MTEQSVVDGIGLARLVRDIPDFPRPGVVFKDITPLLADRTAFAKVIDAIADHFADRQVTKVEEPAKAEEPTKAEDSAKAEEPAKTK